LVASDFSLTYIVVALTLVPLRTTVTDDAKPDPLDNDNSYPVGALTVMSADKLVPLTNRGCAVEAVPAQVENALNVPVNAMDGAVPTVTVTVSVF
jgi:hypothetical protein